MKQISTKQAQRNRAVAKIKSALPPFCCICGKQFKSISELDAMHLLPKLKFPEYYTDEWNIKLGCRDCHTQYDDHLEFRQKQLHLYKVVKENAGELKAYQYFQL